MSNEKVSACELTQLPEEEQIKLIKAWFLKYFHCPSETCFRDDDTGGWVFFSGPWEQASVLEKYFGEYVDQNIINRISEELNDHASEWNSEYEAHEIDDFLLPIDLTVNKATPKIDTLLTADCVISEFLEPEDVF
ncbi:hypothetical protein PTE01_25440 [Pseudoalteromonas tetraodonis GFC]|uniref:Uncharacterized protein n=1 Tax=Pseudoalteromonas tetraodonis GFC TaxID=1315271 RepID=A0AA37S3L4_9GAMM|nr:hypothetical protein [Pseudoalteromonas tetraodonis]ATD04697.1 hypothetical protein PTET_a3526 [Pseudoalteromonas tetraodonis]GEN39434.1 hypothetical protein PTE01_25440 [Pseudoalteromonas tetraodonis GFC]GLQ02655.1 hypothetical protein GCM10007914_15360 [Pseudoalteromonas tetraodonis GFC]